MCGWRRSDHSRISARNCDAASAVRLCTCSCLTATSERRHCARYTVPKQPTPSSAWISSSDHGTTYESAVCALCRLGSLSE